MVWRRRRDKGRGRRSWSWSWDELFDEIDEMFRAEFGEMPDIDELMEWMFRDLGRIFGNMEKRMKESREPFMKGFTVTMGPEGPEFREFGDRAREPEKRKPLVDVIKEDEEVRVVAEMPGVDKEDINIDANENSVDIDAEGERKYSETVNLKCEVIPDSAKARYNNGVLEIVFKRKHPERSKKKKVKVE